MPATYFFSLKADMSGGTDVTAGQDLDRNYECAVDTALVDVPDVIAALALVLGIYKGAPHPSYPFARCTTVTAKRWQADPFRWDVAAKFREPVPPPGSDPNPADPTSPGGQSDPDLRGAEIRGDFSREEAFRGFDRSATPRPFKNSAGEWLQDAPALPFCVGKFTVTLYRDALSYTAWKAYENKRNSDAWNGFPIDSLLITGVAFEPYSERGWFGWKLTIEISHKEVQPEQLQIPALGLPVPTGGWDPVPVLDRGNYYYLPGGVKKVYDEPAGSGVPKSEAGLLNGLDGQRSTDPYYLPFTVYESISFAAIA